MRRWNQKGMVFAVVILGMILFGIFGLTMAPLVVNTSASVVDVHQANQAFYVADGGMQYVLMKELNGKNDFTQLVSPTGSPLVGASISFAPGEFWVEYLNLQTGSVRVKITARVGDAIRVVEQNVGQVGTGMQYVTIAIGNFNANGSTGNIFGDVALRGSAHVSSGLIVHGNVFENQDLEIPILDFNTYKAMCTSTYVGNMTLSSDYTGDLCVDGTVKINNGVTYTGLLYATGSILIEGDDVVVNGTAIAETNFNADHRTGLRFEAQTSGNGDQMPAIASGGNFSIKGSHGMKVRGVTWNQGGMDFTNSNDLEYTGSFITEGNIIMNSVSNLTLTFDAALQASVPGLQWPGTGAGSLSLSDWKTF